MARNYFRRRFSLDKALCEVGLAQTPDECHEKFMHSCAICCADIRTAWHNCRGCALQSYYEQKVWALIEAEAQAEKVEAKKVGKEV